MFLTEAHEQVREMAREFADEVIRPVAGDLDRDERFPTEIYDQMAEVGLFGICVPEEFGGPGFDTLAYALVMEELSRGYASIADQYGLVELICTLLVRHGTEGQKARWIGDVLAAKVRVAYCITEPEAGTDVSGIRTSAARDGDGWVLNGGKIWIHNAPVADAGFVLARTDKDAGHRGMSIFVVDLHSSGVERGPKEHKMGQRASQVGALTFTDVRLPADGWKRRWITRNSASSSRNRSRNSRACSGFWPIWPRISRPPGCSCIARPRKSTGARTPPRPARSRNVSPATWP
jgi:alkylation response protein AidB-like acyl-CoA dehydrogenase